MGLNKDNSSEKEEEYVSGFTRIIKQAWEAERLRKLNEQRIALTEEVKREMVSYFVVSLRVNFLFLITFLTVATLLFHVSNLVYGNPLVNFLIHSNIGLQIGFCVTLTLLIISAFIFVVLKYHKKLDGKTLPKGISKGLNRVFTIGITWMYLSVFHLVFHFFGFFNEYNLYVGYSLFCGFNYYRSYAVDGCFVGLAVSLVVSNSPFLPRVGEKRSFRCPTLEKKL
ncbi:MAG: hypothetical protein ACTSV0_08415 [Candidatus Freyarchaeota archaeon]